MCRTCADQLAPKQRRELDREQPPRLPPKRSQASVSCTPSIVERAEMMVSSFPLTHMDKRLSNSVGIASINHRMSLM